MKKFNIRKVLDGLKEVSSSTPSVQVGPQENHLIQETIQSEHFQLCKVSQPARFVFSPPPHLPQATHVAPLTLCLCVPIFFFKKKIIPQSQTKASTALHASISAFGSTVTSTWLALQGFQTFSSLREEEMN